MAPDDLVEAVRQPDEDRDDPNPRDFLASQDGVHTAALAVDPDRWQLLRFVLWADTSAPDEDATKRYEVLYLSSPGVDEVR